MSVSDISAIPPASEINNQMYRLPYRQIIRMLPYLVNLLNSTNPNLTDEKRAARLNRIRSLVDSNFGLMAVAMGAIKDSDPIYQNIPDTGNIPE